VYDLSGTLGTLAAVASGGITVLVVVSYETMMMIVILVKPDRTVCRFSKQHHLK
jgi:hypothetical protein